jgi:hypothetical protein
LGWVALRSPRAAQTIRGSSSNPGAPEGRAFMRRVDGTCPECERIVALMADAGRAVSAAYKAAQEASGHDAALNAAAIAAKERKATLDDELLSHRDNHAESKYKFGVYR